MPSTALNNVVEFRSWLVEQFNRVLEFADCPEQDEQTWDWYPYIVVEAGNRAGALGWHDLCERAEQFPYEDGSAGAKVFLSACIGRCDELAPSAIEAKVAEPIQTVRQRTDEDKEAVALGLLAKHPDWPVSKIAAEVGVSRRAPYNWPKFRAAWGATKAKDVSRLKKGSKSKETRSVEAIAEAASCAACEDPAVAEHDGEPYCRKCYLEKVEEDQEAQRVDY
jgi:hypothetical protein